MNSYLEILLKILISILLGGLIGYERERHNQPAGLKTHIILCVGATLITIVSLAIARDMTDSQHVPDPTRIAANIVTGIGFLGGGAILRLGATVRGLTTAACLWAIAGVGMAVGAGYYFASAATVCAMLLTLDLVGRWEDSLIHRKMFRRMTLVARNSPDLLGNVERVLSANFISIRNIDVHKEISDPNVELNALVIVPKNENLNKVSEEIFKIPGTIRFELE